MRGRQPHSAGRRIAPMGAVALVVLLSATSLDAQNVKTRRRDDGVIEIYSVESWGEGGSAGTVTRYRSTAPPDLSALIEKVAAEERVDPDLVRAVIAVESAYNDRAVSPKGAQGLMQLMPDTARLLGVRDVFDVEENVQGGIRYLRQMLDRFDGSLELALAGYNAGPEAVERYGSVPPYEETEDYVRRVFRAWGREASEWPSVAGGYRPVQLERSPGGEVRIVTRD